MIATYTCQTCGKLFDEMGFSRWRYCPDCRPVKCNGCGISFKATHGRIQRRKHNRRYHSQPCYFAHMARQSPFHGHS